MTSNQIITFDITEELRKLAIKYAKNAEIGGKSQIFTGKERQARLAEDQLIGQLGEMFGDILQSGTTEFYIKHREECDENPFKGDGGYDLPGNIDIKCSKMRYSQDPMKYNLVVRPRERGEGKAYILALVTADEAKIHLMGQITDQQLEIIGHQDLRFGDAKVVATRHLAPIRRRNG